MYVKERFSSFLHRKKHPSCLFWIIISYWLKIRQRLKSHKLSLIFSLLQRCSKKKKPSDIWHLNCQNGRKAFMNCSFSVIEIGMNNRNHLFETECARETAVQSFHIPVTADENVYPFAITPLASTLPVRFCCIALYSFEPKHAYNSFSDGNRMMMTLCGFLC